VIILRNGVLSLN